MHCHILSDRKEVSPEFPHGMSFKQAGVSHLVSWHEVEDGNMVQGLVEVMGEADTYTRQAKFSTGASKKTRIDKGDPKHDDEQANDNFAHVVKKQRADSKTKTTTPAELGDIIKAAKAKVKDAEGSSAAAASSAAGAEDPSADGAPDLEADEEDEGEAERAAEAALVSICRKRKPE
eukprot:1023758-Lingulodinium_polyedra.AAC.1